MSGEISLVVEAAIRGLQRRDPREFAESLAVLAVADPSELFAKLLELIAELAGERDLTQLPDNDALGTPGISQVVSAIRADDIDALVASSGGTVSIAIARLIAVAAALKARP